MSKLKIEKWDQAADGDLSPAAMIKKLASQGYKCTQYTFSPGTTFPDHTHTVSKKDAIVSGQFKFRMFGEEVILEAGDILEVPKDTVHYAEAIGNKPAIFIDSTK